MAKNRDLGGYGTAATRDVGNDSIQVPLNSDLNIGDWNTAYSWGNHADAGYAVASSLGSASTRDVGTSSGNVAEYAGIYGISGHGYGGANAIISDSSIPVSGFQALPSGDTSFDGLGVRLLTISSGSDEAVQFAAPFHSNRFFSRYAVDGVWRPPVEHWHSGNFLGTISQSGGVPAGAIIERGSNANGEYVKYADGTLICTKEEELAYHDNRLLRYSGSWPSRFSATPSLGLNLIGGTPPSGSIFNKLFRSYSPSGLSTGTVTYAAADGEPDYLSGETIDFTITAIGRWY